VTLKEAIKSLLDYHAIGDNIYDARSRAVELDDWRGESWESPRVKDYAECLKALEREIE
jgi:hypothetical protein